jgi:mycoredoxin
MAHSANADITVYWRPGCPSCSSLLSELRRRSVPYRAVDIWADPAASETVRELARGNETVPTVVVGPVALVDPAVTDVLNAAVTHAPDAVPDGYEAPKVGRFSRWLVARLGG